MREARGFVGLTLGGRPHARDSLSPSMAEWIVIGVVDLLVLLGFRRLGGIGAAGGAFREWGCSATRVDGNPGSCN